LPELPEVETVRRTLEPKITGRRISSVQVMLPKLVRPLDVNAFQDTVEGSIIEGLSRRGKYLLVDLDKDFTIVINLRMTGQLTFCPGNPEPVDAHTHMVMDLEGEGQLRFRDPRKFGTVHLVPTSELESTSEIAALGPEPLGLGFSEQKLWKLLLSRKKKIKQLLLDQTFVAGIGNIYADEILFRAGISPVRVSNTLSPEEVHDLYLAMVGVLSEAIIQRGTSIRDYVDGEGKAGTYQNMLQVYGRKGQDCLQCGCMLETQKLGGRTAHYCPKCQK